MRCLIFNFLFVSDIKRLTKNVLIMTLFCTSKSNENCVTNSVVVSLNVGKMYSAIILKEYIFNIFVQEDHEDRSFNN